MTPRERIVTVLNGEEPDKTPVCVAEGLLSQHAGGWFRRLKERGLGLLRKEVFCEPQWSALYTWQNPRLPDVKYTKIEYLEKGIWKYRQIYETPVGSITGVVMANPMEYVASTDTPEEYLIKQPSDWRVVNYIIREIIDNLAPKYEHLKIAEDELGDDGIVYVSTRKTAWQRAWTEIAGPEQAVYDFHDQPEEIQEYIALHERWDSRQAEFAGSCPVKFVDIGDNTTGDMISPNYYREYCLPIYEIYNQQLAGTGKILGVHMDGRLGNLKKEIALSPIDVVESLTVPPIGDVSLTEVRKLWPDKMVFINTAAHMAWAEPVEVRECYESLAEEWGGKKGLLLELSEELPVETVEAHMSAALDAFGY
jgi:hypothetical protein